MYIIINFSDIVINKIKVFQSPEIKLIIEFLLPLKDIIAYENYLE